MQRRSVAVNLAIFCLGWTCLLLLIGSDNRADAQINVVFMPDTQTAAPGATVTYSATVTNTGSQTIFLNSDDQAGFAGPGTLDDSLFFQNFTGPLAAGQSITDKPILAVLLDATASDGTYLGTFGIKGGSTDTANTSLLNTPVSFSLTVAAVPEISSLTLLSLGAGSLTLAHRLRSQKYKIVVPRQRCRRSR
jgi:hypothetical protein